jgi:hypothetical protein
MRNGNNMAPYCPPPPGSDMQVNDDDLNWIGALSDIFSGENADAQAA